MGCMGKLRGSSLPLPACLLLWAAAAPLADCLRLSRDDPACSHETCRISAAFARHINSTRSVVEAWEVHPAKSTDRVAVTILQPEEPEDIALFNYIIRANMHRLGPTWALLVFYGTSAGREALDSALGRPANVVWRQIKIEDKQQLHITKKEANWFMLSMDFWGQIPQEFQHVLKFESDSLLLKGPGCVEEFFPFNYVGSPWDPRIPWGRKRAFTMGGNGGLSLRRLDTSIAVVTSEFNKKNRDYKCPNKRCYAEGPKRRFPQNEDGEVVGILKAMDSAGLLPKDRKTFPERNHALSFSVEQMYHPSPCGLHNPWEFLTETQAEHLLSTAQMN